MKKANQVLKELLNALHSDRGSDMEMCWENCNESILGEADIDGADQSAIGKIGDACAKMCERWVFRDFACLGELDECDKKLRSCTRRRR
jgi:hypothetical protein